ncbi:MAG TPA: GYF domain-containing protein [Opitutaceae bacterium]|jgi:hypothetical protein
MYTIIGGDGKEYGPVTTEQVRAWIEAGRANRDTQAKTEGTDAWKRIGDFPEFGQTAIPPAVPQSAGPAPITLPGRAQPLNILSCYERSWGLLKADFLMMVGIGIVVILIQVALGLVQHLGVYFLSTIFSGVIYGGWYYYILLKVRGQPATFGDAFAGFSRGFVNLAVIGILVTLFFVLGLVCLILPGIYLGVAYSFAVLLGVDKRLAVWDAMETSRKTITRQWWPMFGLILLGIPFSILGVLCLGVGIFVALPLIVGALVYAYEDLCNPPPVTVSVPVALPAA